MMFVSMNFLHTSQIMAKTCLTLLSQYIYYKVKNFLKTKSLKEMEI